MMDLIRRPSSSLGLSTFEEFDRLLDNFWKASSLPTITNLTPVDISYDEASKQMVVRLQAPGYNEDEIEINVRNGVLEVRGQTSSSEEQKNKENYLMRESHASFARRIVLPEGANADNISAELDKGVLKITVPVERPAAKRIKVAAKSGKAKKLSSKTNS
jgi:HSP20 family protein